MASNALPGTGFSVESPSSLQRGALLWLAAKNDHPGVVELLVEHRADVNEPLGQRTIGLSRREPGPPPGCEALPPDRYVDFQDSAFRLYREGTISELAQDDLASDGVAATTPNTHFEWAIQQSIGGSGIDIGATYTCYASIRCLKTGEEGLAFTYGLYDVANRKAADTSGRAECKDVVDDQYHTFKVGTAPLHSQMYLWVAPGKNPDNVEAVGVDRFWLVKEE